ncbi:hypothetical protein QYS48_33100 [Marivirga arenosa]|uniref:Uncharacterized protein n=1 Tax=Marivirga arenosa TaxID=3059076 RepID=A0AA51RCM4_9BACT|nr:hypothetical protein [Marivirga sp. ABR2-2]WMN06619.1 hypothetical protein QYS48_33100 [Marivirga sp. ABR2-2]
MKKFIYIILYYFIINVSSSFGQVTCEIVLVKRDFVLQKIVLNQPLNKEDSTYFTVLQSDKNKLDLLSFEFDHSAVSSHNLIIKFYDNNELIKLNQANISSVKVFSKTITDIDYSQNYIKISLKEYLGDEPKNGSKIKVEVNTHTGLSFTKWFKYINGWQGYNFLNNKLGIWFPTNMYSTSFQRSDNGVMFTAMPIGLGLGGKYNISQDFYFGISGILNYTLTSVQENEDQGSTYLLQDFSIGGLIDLGGYAYIGYTFPINLTNQETQLKPQFVVGVGIKINQILIGDKN